ncbi:retention module-containing protein [Aestuariicella sp. G3-2]|uniref:retention module-containing protein n=1 Tax=Pseudomaricurvus albidus TaxID=2842452 RepID=UPI001C0BDBD0|nr:retention module-containing protein [Aestuariicella albida]MBU3071702.1 retention module-containing protein [Aestuariicella albida]
MADEHMTENTETRDTTRSEHWSADENQAVQSGVARVTAIQGDVSARSSQQTQSLQEGQWISLNETVLTGSGSALVLTFNNGAVVTLGHDQALTIDQRLIALLDSAGEKDSIDEAVDFDRLAQALEDGQSLEELLPKPAAGENNVASTDSAIEGAFASPTTVIGSRRPVALKQKLWASSKRQELIVPK